MKRTRVLEVLSTLQAAGAENVVLSLASGLDRSRFETGIVSLYDPLPHGLEPIIRERGIPVWHLGKRPGLDPRMFTRLRRLVRDFQPDVIHSHCYVLRYLLHLSGFAMAHTLHSMADAEVGPFGRWIHRFGFRRGVAPVAVGAAVADSFREMYGFAPVTIPNGVDVERFWRPAARDPWRRANGFSDDDLLIVSNGRLCPPKRPDALANAIAGIPHAHLLLAGQGPLRESLEGRERVHLLGFRDDVPDILAAADIFALASDWEGLPLAVVEAMAAGLPVVATQVGSIPEVVEHGSNGWLVPAGDQRALTDALLALAKDPGRRRAMGAAGRLRAQSCSVRSMVDAYADLFMRLLSAPRRGAGGRRTAVASAV